MPDKEIPVTFQPSGRTVYVLAGTRLMEAAATAGVALDMPCGGEGTCGKCRLIVHQGAAAPTAVERQTLSARELDEGVRLGCQSVVSGPYAVEVPPTSLLGTSHQILVHAQTPAAGPADPAIARPCVEPGETQSRTFVVAVDVGTTTLVAVLLDADSGQEHALAARLNPQTAFGDDVLARIRHAQQGPQEKGDRHHLPERPATNLRSVPGFAQMVPVPFFPARGLDELHHAITSAIDEMLGELARQAGVARADIREVVFAGNTTMQQLLAGIDPRALGQSPFVAATVDPIRIAADRLGLRIHPLGQAYIFPAIGGFVGGDTVAGILATRLAEARGPTLLVDIGTNGEIVLAAGGKLLAASTAAGPALEGARITHGMRAATGAIEKVLCEGRLRLNVIGNVLPVGLCGSALIDLAAELLRHGVITPNGRLLPPGQLPDGLLAELRRRVIQRDDKAEFLLVSEEESGTGKPIVLTQRDVRELQLASGAIRAGMILLLRRAGLVPADLEAILVAGGFGNFIRRSNAQRIGLLPPEVPRQRIRFAGNTSLAGARLAALSREARRMAEELARRTEHVDLAADPAFASTFAEAMVFPDR